MTTELITSTEMKTNIILVAILVANKARSELYQYVNEQEN